MRLLLRVVVRDTFFCNAPLTLSAVCIYCFLCRKIKKRKNYSLTAPFFPFHKQTPSKGRFSKRMIRLFTKLCKALLEKFTDIDIFKDATDEFRLYNERCPNCGTYGKLSPYGSYFRNLVSYEDGATVESCVSIRRFECASCGTTHALLPDIVIPYSPYSLRFKLTVLIAYFERNTTVAAVCERFGIAVSTLYSWKDRLLEHKELMLGMLASLNEPGITFLRNLFEAVCLSDILYSFFRQYACSFMQCQPATTTRSPPP